MDNNNIVEAELRIGNTIREALRTKGKRNTPDDVLRMKQEVVDHLTALEVAIEAQQAKINDFTTANEELAEAQRWLNIYCGQKSRFICGSGQLDELLDTVTIRTRDEQQKTDYKALKRRAENLSELIRQDLPAIERFAAALTQVVQYHEDIKRFNQPPKGANVHPKDRIVSKYELLPPIVLDAVLKQAVLCDLSGLVLYKYEPQTVAMARPSSKLQPSKVVNFYEEKKALREAQEQQIYAKRILRELETDAQVNDVTFEQSALIAGHEKDELNTLQQQAEGKFVQLAQGALSEAHQKVLDAAR